MWRVICFCKVGLLIVLGSILFGCTSLGSSSMTINSDGYRKIVIKHPTGKYQSSHNIFMPYQESEEIYTIVLRSHSNYVDANNITVYKLSNLSKLKVTGHIEVLCKNNESYADIRLFTDTNVQFELNGKYGLSFSC